MKKGFTVVEILLAIGLGATLIVLFSKGFSLVSRQSKRSQSLEEVAYQSLAAADLIEHVGRVANSCQITLVSGVQRLRCEVDLTHPSTGDLTWVRFIPVGEDLQYQADSGPGNFLAANVTVRQTFVGVSNFQICGDAEMNMGAGGTCSIQPTEISNVHTATVGANAGRFFRFILSGKASVGDDSAFRLVQGAFFVRNPTSAWAPPNTTYGW